MCFGVQLMAMKQTQSVLIKGFAILLASVMISGCSASLDQRAFLQSSTAGDPCIKCGEDWIFIANEPNAAIRQSKREQGWEWGMEKAPQY